MGCSQSKSSKGAVAGKKHGAGDANGDEPMSPTEIESRIDCIEETKKATFGSLSVRYAYISQRGYYPDDAHKPNQDAYSITHPFEDQETDAFFAVYDGHGRDGDRCAQYARDHLPKLAAKYVARAKTKERARASNQGGSGDDGKAEEGNTVISLTKEQTQAACTKAHIECNRGMHRSAHIDDSLSGTTAISLYLHGKRNRMTVCNVGDSRAILGQNIKKSVDNEGGDGDNPLSRENGNSSSSLRARPLSRDQTPYRRDERKRIRATGARILSLDQIEGLEPVNEEDDEDMANDGDGDLILGEEIDEGGDPPRVWSPHGEYPGTAFTRSLGDAIAEELGVFAEPEMITRELTPQDKIIVLASDGVFEFLTNQSVIDICAKFSDPLEACRAVVAESYELWLQYELRTDDITMICIFVDGVAGAEVSVPRALGAGENPAGEDENPVEVGDDSEDAPVPVEGSKPVRHHLSKEKSQAIQKMKSKMTSMKDFSELEDIESFDINALITEKSDEEKARIAEAIRASMMFQNITDAQKEMIFDVMEPISVEKGEWVIRQGTVGDRFYIVDDGKFEVRIVPEGEVDTRGDGGNVVHVYVGSRENHAHPSFGELALMYSAPRAASIVAQTDGQLWGLHRFAFRKVLLDKPERKELAQVLEKIQIFKKLDDVGLQHVASSMEEATYGSGETIVKQGGTGDVFFVISSGHCECTEENEDGEIVKKELKADEFFGEEVLSGANPFYNATIVAISTTTCWKLDRATFKASMPSSRSIRNISQISKT